MARCMECPPRTPGAGGPAKERGRYAKFSAAASHGHHNARALGRGVREQDQTCRARNAGRGWARAGGHARPRGARRVLGSLGTRSTGAAAAHTPSSSKLRRSCSVCVGLAGKCGLWLGQSARCVSGRCPTKAHVHCRPALGFLACPGAQAATAGGQGKRRAGVGSQAVGRGRAAGAWTPDGGRATARRLLCRAAATVSHMHASCVPCRVTHQACGLRVRTGQHLLGARRRSTAALASLGGARPSSIACLPAAALPLGRSLAARRTTAAAWQAEGGTLGPRRGRRCSRVDGLPPAGFEARRATRRDPSGELVAAIRPQGQCERARNRAQLGSRRPVPRQVRGGMAKAPPGERRPCPWSTRGAGERACIRTAPHCASAGRVCAESAPVARTAPL